MFSAFGLAALAATASAATPAQLGTVAVSRLQELNLEQVRSLAATPHLFQRTHIPHRDGPWR